MAIEDSSPAADQPVIIEKRGMVGVVTFNNPAKHNAMSLDMWVNAREAIATFSDDDDIRCVVLTGAGDKAFVAGADISKFEKERSSVDHIEVYNQAVSDFHDTVRADQADHRPDQRLLHRRWSGDRTGLRHPDRIR